MSVEHEVLFEELCAGCLSAGRRLQRLAGPELDYFRSLVEDADGYSVAAATGRVCWECAGGVRGALRMRRRVNTAHTLLARHATGEMAHLPSLSHLSCETVGVTFYMSHEDTHSDGRPLFVKMEEVDEIDPEYCYLDESVSDVDYKDLKTVLKTDLELAEVPMKERQKRRSKRPRRSGKADRIQFETADIQEASRIQDEASRIQDEMASIQNGMARIQADAFDSSDEEPLTVKRMKKEQVETSDKPRSRRRSGERAAGVVASARVEARLRRLGVAPGALHMVLLSWDEVEAERQRALQSPRYTRHAHRCEDCALGFNHRAKLTAHMDKHQPSAGPLECSACHIRCKHAHALAAHRRRHRVRWRCAACGALSSRAAVAADHAARAHGAPAPTHACAVCPHQATTLGKLRSHMKEHAERQECHLCGKSFRDRASLRTHLFIHAGDKEYACGVCGKRFLFKTAMLLHQHTHDSHQHLYCHTCDVTFKNRMSLYQHMKYNLKHIDPAKLKYGCGECGARFVRASRLAEHRAARHSRTRPVRCAQPHCTYACASRGVLRAHVRSAHGGQRARRDHVCHACGKQYTTKKSLEGHLRAHAGERPLCCALCGASFTYHAALYNHTRLVHHKGKVSRGHMTPPELVPPAGPPALEAPAPPAEGPWLPPTHTDVDVT